MDVVFVLLTIGMFALLALMVRGVDRLWRPTSSVSSSPAPSCCIWSRPSSSRSVS